MKSLLLALGLSAGVVSAGYAALEVAPWLVWLLPLMVCLGALAYVRGGWAAEAAPYFKATLEELSSGRLAPDLRQRLEVELQGLSTAQSRWEIVLRGADAVLIRIWGMSTWDKPALERALVVALVYPLGLLLLVWEISGVGTLGNATVLPAEWGLVKRLSWVGVWMFAPLLGLLGTRRLVGSHLSEDRTENLAVAVAIAVGFVVVRCGAVAGTGTGAGAAAVAVAVACPVVGPVVGGLAGGTAIAVAAAVTGTVDFAVALAAVLAFFMH